MTDREKLIEEATVRGFKKGVKFKSTSSGTIYTFNKCWFNSKEPDWIWSSEGGLIFQENKWAEIITDKIELNFEIY